MPNAPNRRPVWRRVLATALAIPMLIGLGVVSFADPAIWTIVGWAILAGVLAGIVHVIAPPHAAWPPALVALWTVALSWQSPWATITSSLPFPWIVLTLLAEGAFAVATVAGVSYAMHCSQTGQPASWAGYRAYAAQEVPGFTQRTLRMVRVLTQQRIERVK